MYPGRPAPFVKLKEGLTFYLVISENLVMIPDLLPKFMKIPMIDFSLRFHFYPDGSPPVY